MSDAAETPVEILVRFSRRVSLVRTQREVLELLAEAAIDDLGVQGAGVVEITEQGSARFAVCRGLPEAALGLEVDIDSLGSGLGAMVLARFPGRFTGAETLPLVSGGDLFGALCLFSTQTVRPATGWKELASGLADLAALALEREIQYARLRDTRAALSRTEKLRSLGQIAAGISHDLLNLLNPLGLQLQIVKRRLRGVPETGTGVVDQMEETLRCAVETVQRLRDFSRQEPRTAVEVADFGRLAATALGICQPRLHMHPGIELRQELRPALVSVSSSELVGATVNLLLNAIDAMPEGGVLTLTTGTADGGAFIDVMDTGIGMPAHVEARIFEPFFTTKAQGTGLGLAMVYAFVTRHGGTIQVQTGPGKGTRFRQWFPLVPA